MQKDSIKQVANRALHGVVPQKTEIFKHNLVEQMYVMKITTLHVLDDLWKGTKQPNSG
jgi:hypothetical protein